MRDRRHAASVKDMRFVLAAATLAGLVALAVPQPAQAGQSSAKQGFDWAKSVPWRTWDQAVVEAKRTKKPICVVVYTDWCPRCRELAPIFDMPKISGLAKKFVMVHQNRDHAPPWLKKFSETGEYIPRVLFLNSKGELQKDITSGSARYPYFYSVQGWRALVASMNNALARK